MNRRIFISAGLALLGFGRRVWAQVADVSSPVRYASLTQPVRIPEIAVATPWQPVSFVGESRFRERRVLISGVLFRRASAAARGDGAPQAERAFRGAGAPGSIEDLSALCVTCPHEQCHVELVTDEARLVRMVADKPANPLFECGCHFSVFDAARDGARISGESPRGLYRFRIGSTRDGMVEIHEIEEDALSAV